MMIRQLLATLWFAGSAMATGQSPPEPLAPPLRGHSDRPIVAAQDGAALRIEPVPARWAIGASPFKVSVAYRNAPPGAGIMAWITRDVDAPVPGLRYRHFVGSGGAMSVAPVAVEGDGTVSLAFDGQPFVDEADAAERSQLLPGRYVVHVELVNHRQPMVGFAIPPANARSLAAAMSPPIIVDGVVTLREMRALRGSLRRLAERRLADDLDLYTSGVQLRRYLTLGALTAAGGNMCADLTATPPFRGRWTACIPGWLRTEAGQLLPEAEDVRWEGEIDHQPTVLSHRRARDLAIATVRAIRPSPSDRDIGATGWIYRLDRHAWFFDVLVFRDGPPEGFVVQVSDGGQAVIEARSRNSESPTLDRWFFEPDRARPVLPEFD